jgi:hypothetical protein
VRERSVRSRIVQAETGQGTVEWVALVLLVAIALVALAGGVRGVAAEGGERGLGEALARRIAGRPAAAGSVSRPRAARPRPAGPAAAPSRAPSPSREADAFQRLRRVGGVARRAWILCLGYGRWRWELDHPRIPMEPMSLSDAVEIANGCLNPLGFLFRG